MLKTLINRSLTVIGWILGGIGVAAVLLTVLVAAPLTRPPPLASISDTAGTVDRSTMPAVTRFQARDGTTLAYRHYPARGEAVGRAAIVVHGSSGSSASVHALSDALAAHGIETFAVDIRGHGESGARGDIAYLGQLEDDLADLVGVVRTLVPTAPLILIGHSAGGGFALRVAGSPIQGLFARSVLLAPYLGYDAPTNRPNSGGWANGDLPRLIGVAALRRIGVDCCDALPALAFAVPENSEKFLTPTYSVRLMRNFGTDGEYRADLAAATRPLTIFCGADDELMIADRYAEAVRDVAPRVDVRLLAGVNHMAIVGAPAAVATIAEDVARR